MSNVPQDKPTAPWWLATLLAVATVLARLVPHPPNFIPVGALSLFGGSRLRAAAGLLLPIGVMVVSDILLWGLKGARPFNWFVYGSFLVNVLIGQFLLTKLSVWRIGAASLLGSVQFYLVTNFGVWLASSHYSRDLSGLLTCYVAGLPFFGDPGAGIFFINTLLSDLMYSGLMFGLYAVLVPVLQRQKASQLT
jgi:hypothetical protein